jgi:adenylate kinase family enzyme
MMPGEKGRTKVGRRIAVVGTTGSGKTTLARAISRQLHIPHVELDALFWEADWVEAKPLVFRERVTRALEGDRWVVDGNYSVVRDVIWSRADTVVWLDLSLPVMLWRLTRRTLRRILFREVLWGNNRETWRGAFLGRDSLFWWQLTTYRRRRREYPAQLARPEYSHLKSIRLRTPRAAQRWLRSFRSGPRFEGRGPSGMA